MQTTRVEFCPFTGVWIALAQSPSHCRPADSGGRWLRPGAGSSTQRERELAERRRRGGLKSDLFTYDIDTAALQRAQAMDGKLLLVTSVAQMSAEQIVARYKSLADVERGFHVLKSEIEIAPVFHRLPDRIQQGALAAMSPVDGGLAVLAPAHAAGRLMNPLGVGSVLAQSQGPQPAARVMQNEALPGSPNRPPSTGAG